MKKTFYPIVSNSIAKFAAVMFAAFLFSACGEGVESPAPRPTETTFSAKAKSTRTSMDKDCNFYWQANDQIWVDVSGDGSFTEPSFSSEIKDGNTAADFLIRQALEKPSYDLTYTGHGSSSGTQVTIKDVQIQKTVNDATHLGTSGDCGVATANRRDGKYTFELEHKAAYLVIYPYKSESTEGDWVLTKIEVSEYYGYEIAGTYSFNKDGLGIVSNGKSTITLHCVSEDASTGFTLKETVSDHCFIVIRPGFYYLTLHYYVRSVSDPNVEISYEQSLGGGDGFNYSENGVVTIRTVFSN